MSGVLLLGLLVGLALFGGVYAVAIGRMAAGWRRVRAERGHDAADEALPFVSVIVPARDEEASVGACVDALLGQSYPPDRFEVIVVDDLSRDATPAVVRERQRALVPVLPGGEIAAAPPRSRLHLLQTSPETDRLRAHKKRAIALGIEQARGEIIVTTDADVVAPPDWLRQLATCFDLDGSGALAPLSEGATALVSGPVRYHSPAPSDGFWTRQFAGAQALEFAGLVAVGAGSIGARHPTLCNGANVAYRRDVFGALDGFTGLDHLTSGDDELFMQRIAYETPWRVRFCASRAACVQTYAMPSVGAFLQQRWRWASKGAHYPHPGLVAFNVCIYLFFLLLFGSLLALPFAPTLWPAALLGFGLKMIPEAALLLPATRFFGQRRFFWRYFAAAQPLHLGYILLVGALGAMGHYSWKGRQVAR